VDDATQLELPAPGRPKVEFTRLAPEREWAHIEYGAHRHRLRRGGGSGFWGQGGPFCPAS
jgi:hypothetical protein